MATNDHDDDWLVQMARSEARDAAEAKEAEKIGRETEARHNRIFAGEGEDQISALLTELENELRRRAQPYNDEKKDPKALVVDHVPNGINLQAGNKRLEIRVDRSRRAIEGSSTLSGDFHIDDDDRLHFAAGSPAQVADSLLRELFR